MACSTYSMAAWLTEKLQAVGETEDVQPVEIVVGAQPAVKESFDSDKCDSELTLTTDKRSVLLLRRSRQYRCVLGATTYDTGVHDIRIRWDWMPDCDATPKNIQIGMTSNHDHPIYDYPGGPCHGYRGHCTWWSLWGLPLVEQVEYANLGQPWTSGDVIHLHLDIAKGHLKALHERTGKTQTFEFVTPGQRLFVALKGRNTLVTFLPS